MGGEGSRTIGYTTLFTLWGPEAERKKPQKREEGGRGGGEGSGEGRGKFGEAIVGPKLE